MDNEKLVQVAMNVIMHAGDARDYIRKAQTPNRKSRSKNRLFQ